MTEHDALPEVAVSDEDASARGPATLFLMQIRHQFGADDMVLWVRAASALVTEATTVTSAPGRSVDVPLGKGIAGTAFDTNSVVVVNDFADRADLESRALSMQQPDVVLREGWRSAIYVPVVFPPGVAVIAAYSEKIGAFTGAETADLAFAGERAMLRARWDKVTARPMRLARIYDNLSNHVHDIRQAADSALMNVEGVRDGTARASLTRAVDSLKILRGLCERDLRAVAQAPARYRRCRVVDVVAELVEDMQGAARARQIDVRFVHGPRVSGFIDGSTLRRVVQNLITNSMTHLLDTHRSSRFVEVSMSEEVGWVSVHVRDNGPGVQTDRVARIFEPGVTYSPNGFGLGLSQAEIALSNVGGRIRLTQNSFGEGCTFTILIPTERPM